MHLFKTILMASAVIVTGVAFSGMAEARAMDDGGKVTTMKKTKVVVTETPVAGARRVGLVGGRPYPVIEGFKPPHSGGVYYTEDTHTYYANPAVDVKVRNTGSLNH